MTETPSKDFPGWEEGASGMLTFSVVIGGEEIRLAIVTCTDDDAGLWETYIGSTMSDETQLGRWDSSRERSVRKAEEYLIARLRGLT